MNRNPAIELYRVALMFGICLLHAITMGDHNVPWAANVLSSCVVGFVFISGWFGVRFDWYKLSKLYGVGLYAAFVFFVGLVIVSNETLGAAAFKAYSKFIHGFWFLHAYAFMMMLVPLVNAAIDKGGRMALLSEAPLILMVWCWGFGLTLPIVGDKLPRTDGLAAYSGLTLLAIYAAARLCRMYDLDKRIRLRYVFLIMAVAMFATGIGLGDYNSPFAFLLAFMCFLLCGRLHLSEGTGRIVIALAPSMFSVYLIHTNELGGDLIRYVEAQAFGVCGWASVVSAAICVFGGAVILDVPRRVLAMVWKRSRLKDWEKISG